MTGRTLSHYRIGEKLGEGGMGVVYKATDSRLDRTVALKILPANKVTDEERKRRFILEAKSASALNHTNIVTIYDIDQADGTSFIAMEFVDGKTLDQIVPRTGVKLRDLLKYAIQIAAALARAHAAGIIHRDVKPGNIMVTPEGNVKLLDFGLAKLTETAEDSSEAETMMPETATEEGMILGTVAYMAPEQAEGRRVDARSDIFSFGSVLYEMTTGRRAFAGETKMSTLAAILHKEPSPVREIAPDAPGELERIVNRCLRKDPERRFQNMSDVKVALEELKEESESGKLEAAPATPRALSTRAAWALIIFPLFCVAIGAAWWLNRPKPKAPALVRLTSDTGLNTDPALSPDGKFLAFASDRGGEGNLDIWVRQMAGGEAIQLTKDPADDHEPVFSPDSSRIAFRSERDGGGIYVMSAIGGEAKRVATLGHFPQFSPDGSQISYTIGLAAFINPSKSYVVPSAGGQPRQIRPDFYSVFGPIWSPDGKRVLFYGEPQVGADRDWWVAPLDGGAAARLGAYAVFRQQKFISPGSRPVPLIWRPEANEIVFSGQSGDAANLWQVALSPDNRQVSGAPVPLTSGAGPDVQPSIAAGHLAFTLLSENINIWSIPVDANGGEVLGEMKRLTEGLNQDSYPGISRDGSKLAFVRGGGHPPGVWLKALPGGKESLLAESALYPQIAGDGSRISWYDMKTTAAFAGSPGGGDAQKLCETCRLMNGWSHDGKRTLYESDPTPARRLQYITLVDAAAGGKTEVLSHPKYGVSRSRFSPDDRWISFHMILPNARQIFIAPYRGAAAIPEDQWIPVTDGKGMDRYADWSPDGKLLYFVSERDGFRCFWAQRLDPATKHPVGEPFPVQHFHTSRRSLMGPDPIATSMSVAADKIVFSMVEQTGNIWMKELPQ
jgi:Tol biopolymer transport system component/predicted Ser/Thr protein kinase